MQQNLIILYCIWNERNSKKKNEETLEKHFNERKDKPLNMIGMMNVRNRTRVEELVELAKATNNSDDTLLIFNWQGSKGKAITTVVEKSLFFRGKSFRKKETLRIKW